MKPILLKTHEVQAVLNGRKTQIRRVVDAEVVWAFDIERDGTVLGIQDEYGESHPATDAAPYQVGDILYGRETWAKVSDWTDVDPDVGIPDGFTYRADWSANESPKWRPSATMPKDAARLFLRVTDVRVERLQDITEEDVLKEGCGLDGWGQEDWPRTAGFAQLWDYLNAKRGYGWGDNPWVWVYTFEQCQKEKDDD